MRDNFSSKIKTTVARRVNLNCSNPSCQRPTSGPHTAPEKAISIGVAAHIAAAAPGGPRYDGNMTNQERAAVTNALWLCQTCAALVDRDPAQFTTDLLRQWKRQAEAHASLQLRSAATPPPISANDLAELLVEYFRDDILQAGLLSKALAARSAANDAYRYEALVTPARTIITATRNAGPLTIPPLRPEFPATPEGTRVRAAWERHVATGAPVELTNEHLPHHLLPAELQKALPTDKPYTLRIASRPTGKLIVSMTTVAPDGSTHLAPYLEMQTIQAGTHGVLVTNDHQDTPFKFRIQLNRDLSAQEQWTYNLAGHGVHWLKDLRNFLAAARPGAKTVLRDLQTGREYRSIISNAPPYEASPAFDDFVDRVIQVQQQTNAEILVPVRPYPTEEDIDTLDEIELLLAEENIGLDTMTITLSPNRDDEQLRTLVNGATIDARRPYVRMLLDCPIDLGILHINGRAIIHPDDEHLLTKTTNEMITLRLLPHPRLTARLEHPPIKE